MSAKTISKVFVALPIFNLVHPSVLENQKYFLSNSIHQIVMSQVVGASVEHARQVLIERFLDSDCNYLLTIDADILFLNTSDFIDPIDRLISLDKDIVGGIYVYKKHPCLPVYRPLDLQKEYEETGKFPENYNFVIQEEPYEVKFLGNGLKLIKREVVEKVKEKHQCPNLPMIYKGEYLSEDYAFDQRASELGYSIWADPAIKLSHRGTYDYTLNDYVNSR